MADKQQREKTCFVIGPIGEPGSESRRLADWLLKGIVKPVLESKRFDYGVSRADECPDPGSITDQVITAVIEADLVIADLTGHNPNAFYELAIRHMAEKPVIHMIARGQIIPFDTRDYRTIIYDLAEFDGLEAAQQALAEQVEAITKPEFKVSNPITKARGHQALVASADSRDQFVADVMAAVKLLDDRVSGLEKTNLKTIVTKSDLESELQELRISPGALAQAFAAHRKKRLFNESGDSCVHRKDIEMLAGALTLREGIDRK